MKPDNILLYKGKDDRLGNEGESILRGKLIDYDGGCLISDPPALRYRFLDFDEVFAAPEFLQFLKGNVSELSPAMDVFAFAMTCARVLVRSLPMNAGEDIAKGANPKELLGLNSKDIPAPIGDLIVSGLAIDPAPRPTALDFHKRLSDWLGRRKVGKDSQEGNASSWITPQFPKKKRSFVQSESSRDIKDGAENGDGEQLIRRGRQPKFEP